MILGVSFAYVPSMQAVASSGGGLPAIAGAMVVGGAVALVAGLLVRKIRRLFPPVITGTVVFTIGLSLYPTATYSQNVGIVPPIRWSTGRCLPWPVRFCSWRVFPPSLPPC